MHTRFRGRHPQQHVPHSSWLKRATILVLLLPRLASAQLDPFAELSQRVREICGAESAADPGESLLDSEARLARDASDGKLDRAATWRLSCIRAELAAAQTVSRTSYLMPTGSSWRHGASMLAARLLDDAASARAAALLAVLNADHVVAEPADWTLGYLERAIGSGVQHPAVFRGCTEQAWRLPDPWRASACALAGLRSGGDSTLHLLILSRAAGQRADTTMAWSAFLAAARAVRDTVDRADLAWHLNWFLTRSEDSAWRALPWAETGPWVRDLLLSRDIRDGRAPGARVVEHINRLAYVHEHFRLKVVPVQRGRLMGGVAIPEGPGGGFSVEVVTPDSRTPAEAFREFVRWQIAIDDRGAVWMRFGAPQQREYYTVTEPGNYLKRETWRYDIDGRELVLSFESEEGDGTQDATRLVTAVVGEHFCGITVRRCVQAERALAAAAFVGLPVRFRSRDAPPVGLPVNEMLDLRREDQTMIFEATTKDNNTARLDRHLDVTAQFLRLWHPRTGVIMALVPWAIAADDLTDGISNAAKKARALDLRLELRWYDPSSGMSRDSSIVGSIPLPKRSGSDAFVSGVAVMSASPGITAWSVVAVRDSSASGRSFTTAAEPLAGGPLQLSDLVLGVSGHGVSWSAPTGPVVLAPLGTVERKTPVQLYYQVRNTLAATELATTVAVAEVGRRDAPPAFNVTFRHQVTSGINEMRRELDLDRLKPGRYLLTVVVSDEQGQNRVTRSTALLVR